MPNLLPELITDILCRLPVKTLLRFKFVSKAWFSLIDDPYFIKLHLNQSLKTNTNLTLILADNNHDLFSVDLDTLNTAIKLNNPIEEGGGLTTKVLGSCNGLVALFHSHKHLALWNPSTRKYHKLPTTPIEILVRFSYSVGYGFGYDPVSNDYKLLRIVVYYFCKDLRLMESQVKVYSLKSNSWRQTRDFPYYQCYYPLANGTLANNTLHWTARTKSERDSGDLIVAFDLQVEEYFEVPKSDYMDYFICLESLGGCLCVLCDYDKVGADVWVMKEYGLKESWVKLFSMALSDEVVIVKPLAYSKSGDRVLLYEDDYYDEKFVWYDMRRKRAEEVRIQGAPKSYEMKMCVASLVPLMVGVEPMS